MFAWLDDRLGAASFARRSLNKIFPDHWSFMLGEVTLYCFVILVLTGIFLSFFYVPDIAETIYRGPYDPIAGQEVSRAYESVLRLSFEVQAGLVFRQIHHWAALVMTGAVVAHAARVFFTGAFRRPRDINWMLGVALLILTLAIGFAGYSLPDDLLSGTGLRIAYSILLSIPLIGTWLAFLAFGGEYPSPDILNRLFVIHVMILPALIAAVLTVHLALVWHQKHTHFPGNGRSETNIQGERLWPRYAMKSAGLFFAVLSVLSLLGGLVQINPVWLYGPYEPTTVSAGSQPDWYMGWLEGALRLWPDWEIRAFGYEIANPFFPAVLLPGLLFTGLFLWPAIERRITNDRGEHNLLDFPREVPWRTALGVAILTFITLLTLAGGNDIIAVLLGVSVESITRMLRVVVLVVPILAFVATYRIAEGLRRTGFHPVRQPRTITLARTAEGGFEAVEETPDGEAASGEAASGEQARSES